jgi:glutamate formiminotransferase/formiminotetrahydrofolate cyclodeaminase
VCPFIPLRETTMEECVTLAKEVGERVARELQIPVYLYEFAAANEARRNLANIRRGEFEKLSEKFADPEWAPDFMPLSPRPEAGATVIGARRILIAFNVNIKTSDAHLATKIASHIRSERTRPGTHLTAVKALGWYMAEFGCAQVSLNLTDLTVTGMHHAFTAVKSMAERLGAKVTGSEVVGLVPRRALVEAGLFFMGESPSLGESVSQEVAVERAVREFGLNDVRPFVLTEKVLEDRLGLRETF